MEPTDITIEILKDIRQDMRGLREEARATNERLDRLEHRQVETEIRLATQLVAVTGAIHELRDDLRQDRALKARVDDHERRIHDIEARV